MFFNIRIKKKLAQFEISFSFSGAKDELLVMIGPSGAGKTTIIRCIAGLETPDEGYIECGGRIWFDSRKDINLPPRKRKVGYVFQEYSLFPHLNIYKNVAFGCNDRKYVSELLEKLGITHLKGRKPADISGGERQRVAFAQALASNPNLLLLDEPFSALDPEIRHNLQIMLTRIRRELCIPIIMVTHNMEEAEILADRILPVHKGQAEKCIDNPCRVFTPNHS